MLKTIRALRAGGWGGVGKPTAWRRQVDSQALHSRGAWSGLHEKKQDRDDDRLVPA